MALTLFLSLTPLTKTLSLSLPKRLPNYQPYLFLSKFTGQYDVVLADIQSSWIVPTYGGKVVAALHPLAFVPDQDTRRSDLERFFGGEASLAEGQQIIEKYGASYLLLTRSEYLRWGDSRQSLAPQEQVVFESDRFVLISMKPQGTL
jgi:hypothetical protein